MLCLALPLNGLAACSGGGKGGDKGTPFGQGGAKFADAVAKLLARSAGAASDDDDEDDGRRAAAAESRVRARHACLHCLARC